MCISCEQLPCVASSFDDEVDLDAGPERQRSHPDRRAGGKGRTEVLCVDAIHRDEVTHPREKHAGAHGVIEILPGRLENCREIPEDALCLGHNTSLDHLASGRVLGDLSAEVEETTDFDRLGKRADRWRELRRDDCSLAHGRLPWILRLDNWVTTASTHLSADQLFFEPVMCIRFGIECLDFDVSRAFIETDRLRQSTVGLQTKDLDTCFASVPF